MITDEELREWREGALPSDDSSAIVRLLDEVERLREENQNEMEARAEGWKRANEAEAEVERLRALLSESQDDLECERGKVDMFHADRDRLQSEVERLQSIEESLRESYEALAEHQSALALAHEALMRGIAEIGQGNNREAMNAMHEAIREPAMQRAAELDAARRKVCEEVDNGPEFHEHITGTHQALEDAMAELERLEARDHDS